MQVSEQGLSLIRQFEGFQPHRYLCPAGVATIGYGHVIRRGEDFSRGISEKQAENLLKDDIQRTENAIGRYVAVSLNQNQFDALASFIYNIGAGAFSRSTLRRVINRGWHDEAPEQMLRWVYSGKKRLPGLIRRRMAEAELYGSNISIENTIT